MTILGAASLLQADDLEFYRDVYPFLKANCISCHNKTTTKAKLNMETPDLMKKGGDSGPAILPGNGADSLLVKASAHTKDMEMPPPNNKSGASNLSPHEIAVLQQWIDQGARSEAPQEREVVWQPLAPGVHPIYAVAMTKDGRYAACGRSNQIFVYDLATRQFVTQIMDDKAKTGSAHRALVQSLAFSPDGTRLASGSFREVKIWRLEPSKAATGKASAAPPGAMPAPINEKLAQQLAAAMKATVLNHAWTANGKQLVTGCSDGMVRVWDAETGKLIAELKGNITSTQQIAALDQTIAEQALEQAFQTGEAARIDAQNKSLDELLKKAKEAIAAMNKVLPEKQKAVKPAQDAKAEAQKGVNDVQALIAKAPGGKPDAALTKQLKDAQEKLQTTVRSETSALAAVSAAQSNVKDAEADVKRITDTKARNTKDLAAANAFIDKAKKAQARASTDLAAAKLLLTKTAAKPIAVILSADTQRAAAMFDDGALNVWAVATGMPVEQMTGSATAKAALVCNANGTFTATKEDNSTCTTSAPPHWVLERVLGGVKARAWFADRVNAVRFNPDGRLLAAGGGEPSRSGDITIFEVAGGKAVKTWKERHQDTVLSLDFSPDGRLLASGASDKMAKVTEVSTGKQVNLFEGHTHHVTGVAFRADGRVLASAGADGVVMTWDMILGERKKKIEGWTKEVTSLQFIGATNEIVTSAGDNLVRIVNDEGKEIRAIAKLPDFMQAAASTSSGGTIIGGGEDSVLRVWDGTNGKEVAVFGWK